MTGSYAEDGPGRLFARLDVGVALFFVLSGFLLALPMLRAVASREPPRAPPAAYLWRRALRVLPVYWLTVAARAGAVPRRERGRAPPTGCATCVLGQIYGWGWLREGLTHTWSLCTEVSFYAVLPLLVGGPGPAVGRSLAAGAGAGRAGRADAGRAGLAGLVGGRRPGDARR